MPSLREVLHAEKVIRRYLNPTPLVWSRRLSREIGAEVRVKLENLNPTNSFKVRGGIYLMSVLAESGVKGVVTASMGNHAQSIAYAGSLFGVPVKVVMPGWVSRVKVEAVEELGAEVILKGDYYDQSAEYAEALARELGYRYVPRSRRGSSTSAQPPCTWRWSGICRRSRWSSIPSAAVQVPSVRSRSTSGCSRT